MSIFIVVADAGRARIFVAAKKKAKFLEVDDLIHPNSRLKGSQIESDGPGTIYDSHGQGRHSVGNAENIHKYESEKFARKVCKSIKQSYTLNKFSGLYLIAPPEFLGFLRMHIDSEIEKLIAGEIDKDIVQLDTEEISSYLQEFS